VTRVAGRAAGLMLLASVILAARAFAFDVSPGSLTIQAGDMATGTLSSLPIASDGSPACIESASGTSIYLSTVFTPPCGGKAGWSSSMTVRTIPATPAGTYTIVFQVCPTPSCSMGPDIRNAQPIETKNWTVVVTAAPVPGETVPATDVTSQPPGTSPPAAQTPRATPAPTPSRSVARTVVPAVTTPSATQPQLTPVPSQSPAVAAVGLPPGLVLNHPALKAGQTLKVSGTGCTPGVPTTVSLPGSVTATTTAGTDGAFQVSLHLPSSLPAGRYTVAAQCGVTLSSLVDVQRPRSLGAAILIISVVLALVIGGLIVRGLALGRR